MSAEHPFYGWRPYSEIHPGESTVSGHVVVWPELAGTPEIPGRELLAYLPPSLAFEGLEETLRSGRRYPVIYFHDGQNVFDDHTSYSGEWHADETLEMLADEGLEAIAIGVPNAGDARMDEYNPWRSSELWQGRRVGGRGDAYLDWLVRHVKPLVDASFPTLTDRMSTAIVGSSMGGLISLYAALCHADTFGLAGVMSPAILWSDYRVLRLIADRGVPPSRIHVDMGGREWRGMTADTRRLRDALVAAGMVEGRDLNYVEERHAAHHEEAWARRLPDALRFLFGPRD